ncbi:MAG: carbohydrate kinase [Cyclobacteriaceae bacterium]|nr:carbohydrate kinase [Cyclobacteriaceae bacterium]
MYNAICFGEVLWDIFPTYKIIGGAPLNVALRLHSFGVKTSMISRVGNDRNGNEILRYINDNLESTSTIQTDKVLTTGKVEVALDKNGAALYDINYPVAWDKIEVTERNINAVKSSDVFIFGSLACRDKVTRNTLETLLHYSSYKVLDVNLRPPFYTMELLLSLMKTSDFIKCNDDELNEICVANDFQSNSIVEQINFLSQLTNTKQICVTKGKHGAELLYNGDFFSNSGYPTKVVDTVGAGDSFLATLISHLLRKANPNDALNYACAVGALIAGKTGANPILLDSEIEEKCNS